MKLLNKIKNKPIENNEYDIALMNNYMLTDIRKNDLVNASYSLSLSKVKQYSPLLAQTSSIIKHVTDQNKSSETLYKVINLEKNDTLKAMKGGKTFWGAIKKHDKSSTMAQLKEVKHSVTINPAMLMMAVSLANIEAELGEIKETTKKIYSFLEHEKESEIESDLEILNKSINDFKFNLNDEKYLANNYKQVLDIKRTANKNMIFYKKEISEYLTKGKMFTIDSSMKNIINNIISMFKYYRLSLYTYSFSTLIEILLLGNYNEEYLLSKQDELNELDKNYLNLYLKSKDYININANKSLEGNVLNGLGSAGKVIGNLASKTKVKKVDDWIKEKSDNLKQNGQNIKEGYVSKFYEIKETYVKPFVNQIDNLDIIYNQTKEIYFDENNLYLK